MVKSKKPAKKAASKAMPVSLTNHRWVYVNGTLVERECVQIKRRRHGQTEVLTLMRTGGESWRVCGPVFTTKTLAQDSRRKATGKTGYIINWDNQIEEVTSKMLPNGQEVWVRPTGETVYSGDKVLSWKEASGRAKTSLRNELKRYQEKASRIRQDLLKITKNR